MRVGKHTYINEAHRKCINSYYARYYLNPVVQFSGRIRVRDVKYEPVRGVKMIREKLNQKFRYLLNFLFEDPKRFVRIVVLSVCSIVVIFQVIMCAF